MKREDLIAPLQYNLVSEIERYASKKEKLQLNGKVMKGKQRKLHMKL